ncbi:MAG: heparinase II/III family protein [Candidatus Hodarchaeota archaeon]
MKIPLGLSDLKNKAYKAKEITSFYISRYMDWEKVPETNSSFFSNLQSDASVIRGLLFQNIDVDTVMQDADKICSGELRLYNLDSGVFNRGVNWHKDYYSGYEWPVKPFNLIYSLSNRGRDLNVPLELSRLQFIPTLIQGFEITSDLKYINRLTDLIDSWIEKNPYCFGVNWWTGMEVALRGVNLALAVGLISNHIASEKLKTYLNVLWKHALYIHKYDIVNNRAKTKNNHFLASMLGLLAVSVCFEGSEATEMRQHALSALRSEIMNQFMRDGGNFESSTGYHQFSLEVVLVAIFLLRVFHDNDCSKGFVNTVLGKGVRERIIRALHLVSDYMSCYGESPHIGDSSDCRVLVFKDYFDRKVSDHSFLLELGKYALKYEPPANIRGIAKHYPQSGYAFFRNNSYGLVAFAGPKGTKGTGGHGHNDKCSFVMQVDGTPIFVDSGTYIYNSHIYERYEQKRTKAHNVIMIDDEEQCLINPEIVFGLEGMINAHISAFKNSSIIGCTLQHDGYKRFDDIGLHTRKISCFEHEVEITDSVEGSGYHNVCFFLNLDPSVMIVVDQRLVHLTTKHTNISIVIPAIFSIQIEECFISQAYHQKTETRRIVAKCAAHLPFSWKIKIKLTNHLG